MVKVKNTVEHLRNKKEIEVELIPAYMPDADFQDKKEEVQNLISRILLISALDNQHIIAI